MSETGSNRFLFFAVFLAGIGTLGIEMAMPRLLAPYFGNSQPIWAVVIGMTLIYLAIGYWLGGALADRNPNRRLFYQLIAWAGFLCGFIPLIAQPILSLAQQSMRAIAAGGFIAALFAVLLLFAAPVILLATVGPFAVRLHLNRAAEGVAAAGRTAGSISSISALGSIVGAFLPVLVLIPWLGTDRTIFLFAGFLLVLGIIGLRDWRYVLMLVVVAGLALFVLSADRAIRSADCYRCIQIAETESQYNYIQVAAQDFEFANNTVDPRVVLILNEGRAIHSIYRLKYRQTGDPLDTITGGGPWDYFSVTPYVYPNRDPDSVRSLALIGSAAGTIPKQFLAIYGSTTQIDAVEIDPAIIEMGRKYFDLEDRDPRYPNYTSHAADGRYWLSGVNQTYDVIGMDAYHQPYIPFHLTTVEFFQEVRAHLNPDGVAVVNAGLSPSGDDSLANAIASTMLEVFPQVFVIDTLRSTNAILIGVNRPVGDGTANFIANSARIESQPLQLAMYWSIEGGSQPIREFTPDQARFAPFTDDHAPVEQLIDGLIFRETSQRISR